MHKTAPYECIHPHMQMENVASAAPPEASREWPQRASQSRTTINGSRTHREEVRNGILSVLYPPVGGLHVRRLKRRLPGQKRKHHHSQRPDVDFERVAGAFGAQEHLGCDVVGRAADCLFALGGVVEPAREAKVANLVDRWVGDV